VSTLHDPEPVRLPSGRRRPSVAIARRVVVALGLVLLVAATVYLGRDGYVDDTGREVTFLTAVYYATVTITTTGYGDITPVTEATRLATTLIITPARVLFLIVLVGTTLEVLTEHWRGAIRIDRWRRRVNNHYVVCGYGTKGRAAIATLIAQGVGQDRVVVVDPKAEAVQEANAAGLAAVHGDASRTVILTQAEVQRAQGIVVATDRDDANVLITLTARELNRSATIVAAVREEENAHLLREGGADSVITSAEASGRLLGLATRQPLVADILEDLLTVGEGLDVVEREVRPDEVGGPPRPGPGELVMAIHRGARTLRFDAPESQSTEPGDRLVIVCVRDTATTP
jgi:voltage-gated potassium channel